MDKLKINLIPPEIKEKKKKEAKRSVVNRISIGLLGVLIIVTAGVLGVIVIQSTTLNSLNADIEAEKGKIGALKDKEAVAFFLKNRIDTIGTFSDKRYKQGEYYQLISSLRVGGVEVQSLQIDKSDKISLSGETYSTTSLAEFFKNLTDPGKNEGLIIGVNVESLSRTATGAIRFSLMVTMKEKAQ